MTYYQNFDSIKTIDDVKTIFREGIADENNWCLLSTSGIHGAYTTLDEIDVNHISRGFSSVTVLIIRPRIVSMLYGHINVTRDDIPYLRKLVNSSIDAIKTSQEGNRSRKEDE